MPSKAEFYRQMAEQVSTQLVGSWKEWTAFLTTAARLYKYIGSRVKRLAQGKLMPASTSTGYIT